jgi:prepilin-type N-terminal cleavage/methylation domain-containing protein
MAVKACSERETGFSLVEILIALAILSFGLLSAGPLLYSALTSDSLARSKSAAAIAAQNKLESLASLYSRNPTAEELMVGGHGPESAQTENPIDAAILNRFDVDWTVSQVPDPRPGKIVNARLITVRVAPVNSQGMENNRTGFNKTLNISTIFSPSMQGRKP